ncbi:hypothetical protein [Elizabethkingia sp. M8]|nr:hypothetical protein [Elizabethkingia sp. M8]
MKSFQFSKSAPLKRTVADAEGASGTPGSNLSLVKLISVRLLI